uniref:Uncharacterized protein n=1 Tax=Sus scrofa TaxID=9823 RepID=A0A4X1SLI7_PIG
ISKTNTRTFVVPDLGGDPPSRAVSVNLSSGSFSRSRVCALSRTNSGSIPGSRTSICHRHGQQKIGIIVVLSA